MIAIDPFMQSFPQFILYRLIPQGDKTLKKPLSHRTLIPSDPHDPNNWLTHQDAQDLLAKVNTVGDMGIGFVFTENDPFWFLDIDHALEPDGTWSDLVNFFYNELNGSAFEVSQSGEGVHMFGSGFVPEHACKNIEHGLELYDSLRFVALTGKQLCGSATLDTSAKWSNLVPSFFTRADTDTLGWTNEPVEEYTGPKDDDQLLKAAFGAKSAASAFGGVGFKQLWEADAESLADKWPSDTGKQYDASSADASLASSLAFWTGKDCERIKRLMLRSGLVRDKWKTHKSYLERTITNSVGVCKQVFNSPRNDTTPDLVTEITRRKDSGLCTGEDQLTRLKGCVYVVHHHRVLTPDGDMLKPESFNGKFGGMSYVIDNTGKVTKKAFECLIDSQLNSFPKVDRTEFRPDRPYQAICNNAVNVYKPFEAPMNTESPQPFLTHIEKLLPNHRDQQIILSWMAANLQYKGKKILWAPVIQGTHGNGKSLITSIMAELVGEKYFHQPKAQNIDNNFNVWMRNKLIIGIEDIYIPNAKAEIMEILKPLISETRLEIEGKGADQITESVCANFILNTNHRDGIIKTDEDRRYAVFYTAQQMKSDITRDGMNGDYFPNLWNWLRASGYGAINNYLINYAIPDEFNPQIQAHRAPDTSTTSEAIFESLGPAGQDIQEAIAEGRVGFCGGWISFPKSREFRKMSPQKLHKVIENMGYSVPTALGKDQRTNGPTVTDGVKTKLFLRNGNPIHQITDAGEILKKYDTAQCVAFASVPVLDHHTAPLR